MNAEEIIEKLRPTLRQEGLEIEFLGVEGPIVNLRAKRVAPGVPVAFLVKAIAGTFKRYLPEVEDVCLIDYDPGEAIPTAPSETFAPVFSHKPPVASFVLNGLPVVDLSGLNRREAILAIEGFVKVWGARSPALALQGLSEDAPGRAARKWANVYGKDYHELITTNDNRWEITVSGDSSEEIERLKSKDDEVMPGRIFLTSEEA